MSADRATAILAEMPTPDYNTNYQPHYAESDLAAAITEMCSTEPIVKPASIYSLRDRLGKIVTDDNPDTIIIEGRCAEPVDLHLPIGSLVSHALVARGLVQMHFGGRALHIRRHIQGVKPRSSEFEETPSGLVVSYMGDGINSADPRFRNPDASRLVAMGLQGRDLTDNLDAALGYHLPIAHEALSLPFENSFKRRDPKTGELLLATADMPWIGLRTNNPDGDHVRLLSDIANPVGVKIGSNTIPDEIIALNERLNPNNIPGKLTFMLRTGPNNTDKLSAIAEAIAKHAPNSLTMHDIHGDTRQENVDGQSYKLRVVTEIVGNIACTSEILEDAGLNLNGIHIETTPYHDRLECVDEPGELPTHPGGVDPQLNPRQTHQLYKQAAPILLAS